MLVEVYRVVFLHLSGFLYFYPTFLGWLFEHIELLLDLVYRVVGHGARGVHSQLQLNVELFQIPRKWRRQKQNGSSPRSAHCTVLYCTVLYCTVLTPSALWTRCISELRHCCTVWYRLRGLWAYRCWNGGKIGHHGNWYVTKIVTKLPFSWFLFVSFIRRQKVWHYFPGGRVVTAVKCVKVVPFNCYVPWKCGRSG